MTRHLHYRPPRLLGNGHAMTVAANLLRRPVALPVLRERWELPDGDFLDVDRLGGRPGAPLVILCHGLEGSSEAGYVRGTMALLAERGVDTLALNFRGCSGEMNRLPRFYHSGETGDLGYVLDRVIAERPGRPLGLVGFSLGGNVTAKLVGERGGTLPSEVRAAAVISTPFDLDACCRAIDGPGLPAWAYRERFLRRLRKKALTKAARFPGQFDTARIAAARTLRAYDDALTAPLHGFADAADYYAKSSAGRFLDGVARPLLVVNAEDDPMVPGASLPHAKLRENPHIEARISPAGGHVGFLDGPPWRWRRFAEHAAADFLARHLQA